MIWNWDLAREAVVPILQGFEITLLATVLGSAVAVVLGLIVAMLRRAPTRWIRVPVRVYVEFIRSTPMLVQLFAAYILIPQLNALTIGVAILGIHYSTYMSEVYRAGIDGVPKGQWEATTALSLPRARAWRAVILPQALRNVLPALGNYMISMFKETPFLFVIGVQEMVFQANDIGGNNFRYIEVYTMAAVLFLIASVPTSIVMRKLEKRLGH